MRGLRRPRTVSVMQESLSVEEYRYRAAIVQRAAAELATAALELPRADSGPAWSGPARTMLDWCVDSERRRLEALAPELTVACRQLVYFGDLAASMTAIDCG